MPRPLQPAATNPRAALPRAVPTRADVGLIVAAILLPPFAVFRRCGAGRDFMCNCALTVLGVAPGIAHALWRLRGESRAAESAVEQTEMAARGA